MPEVPALNARCSAELRASFKAKLAHDGVSMQDALVGLVEGYLRGSIHLERQSGKVIDSSTHRATGNRFQRLLAFIQESNDRQAAEWLEGNILTFAKAVEASQGSEPGSKIAEIDADIAAEKKHKTRKPVEYFY